MTSAGSGKYLLQVRWDQADWAGSWTWRERTDLRSIYWTEIQTLQTPWLVT